MTPRSIRSPTNDVYKELDLTLLSFTKMGRGWRRLSFFSSLHGRMDTTSWYVFPHPQRYYILTRAATGWHTLGFDPVYRCKNEIIFWLMRMERKKASYPKSRAFWDFSL